MIAPSLYIAVPCFRSQLYTNCATALLELSAALTAAGASSSVHFIGDAAVSRARNSAAAAFLKSGCSHLLMVDDDVGGFHPDEIAALMALDVAAMACPRRGSRSGFVVNLQDEHVTSGQLPSVEVNGKRLVEVLDAGAGIMCIRREVFTRMVAELGDAIAYVNDSLDGRDGRGEVEWDFFGLGRDPEERRRYLSEDYMFCRRWQKLGGKVHVLVDAHPTHFGAHEFTSEGTATSLDFATWLRAVLAQSQAAE